MFTLQAERTASDVASSNGPAVEIVVPVYNEVVVLAPSVRRLHAYLAGAFPFTFRIVVADNGSTDGTWEAALEVAGELTEVRAVRLQAKGRGRALHAVWSSSDATVLAYTDVDLSTDLSALLPLVAPLLSGHSDVAIGSRLARGASSYRWVAAVIGANSAAGAQLATGEPVMAIGGFNGTDPAPSLAEFEADVAAGRIHYFIADGGGGGGFGASSSSNAIASWVASHYTAKTVGGVTVYDLT